MDQDPYVMDYGPYAMDHLLWTIYHEPYAYQGMPQFSAGLSFLLRVGGGTNEFLYSSDFVPTRKKNSLKI